MHIGPVWTERDGWHRHTIHDLETPIPCDPPSWAQKIMKRCFGEAANSPLLVGVKSSFGTVIKDSRTITIMAALTIVGFATQDYDYFKMAAAFPIIVGGVLLGAGSLVKAGLVPTP